MQQEVRDKGGCRLFRSLGARYTRTQTDPRPHTSQLGAIPIELVLLLFDSRCDEFASSVTNH